MTQGNDPGLVLSEGANAPGNPRSGGFDRDGACATLPGAGCAMIVATPPMTCVKCSY